MNGTLVGGGGGDEGSGPPVRDIPGVEGAGRMFGAPGWENGNKTAGGAERGVDECGTLRCDICGGGVAWLPGLELVGR